MHVRGTHLLGSGPGCSGSMGSLWCRMQGAGASRGDQCRSWRHHAAGGSEMLDIRWVDERRRRFLYMLETTRQYILEHRPLPVSQPFRSTQRPEEFRVPTEGRYSGMAGTAEYIFVYPCVKIRCGRYAALQAPGAICMGAGVTTCSMRMPMMETVPISSG